MATKLKNLEVTSVDLVDQGANPDAHIQLFKRAEGKPEGNQNGNDGSQGSNQEGNPEGEPTDGKKNPEEPTETEKGLFKKLFQWVMKGGQGGADPHEGDGVQKGAKLFAETMNREIMERVIGEMYDCCYALSDSLSSILCDKDLTPDSRKAMMEQSLKEFLETMDKAVGEWANGKRVKDKQDQANTAAGIQKSEAQKAGLAALLEKRGLTGGTNKEKEEYDTMKIDKSKMTPEELTVLDGFEKKYGAAEPEGNPEPGGVNKGKEGAEPKPDEVNKGASGTEPTPPAGDTGSQISGEIAKALAEVRTAYAAQTAEVEELKKSLETERLLQVAKKYEVLGKKPEELVAKFYDMKKAGGTVYDDYIALLDESVSMIGKSRLFGEIGSNRQGSAGIEETIGIKAAELAKAANGNMTSADAVIKAFEENPELAAQYEEEYMGR